jgi:signal peptidase II
VNLTKKNIGSKSIAVLLAILAFTLDLWSKASILAEPSLIQHIDVEITPFFNLVLVFNRGVSFGMLAEQNQPIILTIISLFIISILLVWWWRNNSHIVAAGIGLVIGGALGNVLDRVRLGAVVDFLDFHVAKLHWPAFNLADSFVFIGVIILCAHSIYFEPKRL